MKIKKLVTVVRETKAEVHWVQFELNMKITEMQLKMQPTTPSEMWEQRRAAIKEGMATLDATFADCLTLFE